MHQFNWFVLPFSLGLLYLMLRLVYTYVRWIKDLPLDDRIKIGKGLFTHKSIFALKEVFLECLLHRKIFKVNPLLGYMHMSLAFGWFLLILFGNWECRIFYHAHLSLPYVPIFFRFFNPHPISFVSERFFSLLMDITLLMVLSGVALAWTKRMYSRLFGMRKTTVLKWGDKFALYALWFIFPFRFLAEIFSSANYGGGHFLTSNAGAFFGSFLPVQYLSYPAWWAYSFALGIFFVALPYSRYMHIPTEIVLIFLRKYGVTEKASISSYTELEVSSCSRCGVCIDQCQLTGANIPGVQSVYFIQNVRNKSLNNDQSLNCLMCGRCDSICPVGIDISAIRRAGRAQKYLPKKSTYHYIPHSVAQKADVVFFAGCMTHLQPSVKKSMITILKASGEKFWFMDEAAGICCGRPLILAGKEMQARELIAKNKSLIIGSGAKTLVTSCPICYKVFNEDYHLDIQVMHHSEYLLRLVEEGKIEITPQKQKAVYHDPCELGRGSGIYNQPRELLSYSLKLQSISQESEQALCCGGSLANLKIAQSDRKKITEQAVEVLTESAPDLLITGCPMCKKTFSQSSPIPVLDIAEVVSGSLLKQKYFVELDEEYLLKKNLENYVAESQVYSVH
jgi:Fe-S oxidoreductase